MTWLFAICLALTSPSLPDSIQGTWQRTLVTTDETTGTVETQTVFRSFSPQLLLTESVVYQQQVRWTDDETVVLQFRSTISGEWLANGRDIVVNYRPRTLRVVYEGVSFPEHDAALQNELRQAFERKNKHEINNYVSTMRNVLKSYFRRNSGSALTDIHFQGEQFTAKLSQETVAFQRVP